MEHESPNHRLIALAIFQSFVPAEGKASEQRPLVHCRSNREALPVLLLSDVESGGARAACVWVAQKRRIWACVTMMNVGREKRRLANERN